MKPFELRIGDSPVLISNPHDGAFIPPNIAENMTPDGRRSADSDWHVGRLYEFASSDGHTHLRATHSRYVIDLNRPAEGTPLYPGQDETGLCPHESFARDALYRPGQEPDEAELRSRIARYWMPYHEALKAQLQRLREAHGFVLLWEGHSIASRVPRFFDGVLPEFNFGTDAGRTLPTALRDRLVTEAEAAGYTAVADQRFRGGYITRHYAAPDEGVYTIQLELSQATYLDEASGNWDGAAAGQASALIRRLVDLARRELA